MVSAAAMMVSAYLPPVNMCWTLTSIDPFLFCKLPAHIGTGCKLMVVFNSRLWQVRPKRCVIGWRERTSLLPCPCLSLMSWREAAWSGEKPWMLWPAYCMILSFLRCGKYYFFHAIGAHNCMSFWSGELLTIAVTSAWCFCFQHFISVHLLLYLYRFTY
jgi:hypothetical protein